MFWHRVGDAVILAAFVGFGVVVSLGVYYLMGG
jgi:hypothetical protein